MDRTRKRLSLGSAVFFGLIVVCIILIQNKKPLGLLPSENLNPTVLTQISGFNGAYDSASNSFALELDRPGLSTSIQGINIPGDFGMKSVATVTGTPENTILLGDIPLREWEVNPTIRMVLEAGLTVTAIHNRFLMDSNRIMSLHFEGRGTQDAMANALGKVFKNLPQTHPPRENKEAADFKIEKSTLRSTRMEQLLWKGETTENGIFKIHLARATSIDGKVLGATAGADSWAEFAGNQDRVAVNGEIATLEFELPFVLKDLMQADIQITSVHIHMTQEKPKLIFVHFWGVGQVEKIAAGVKAAIWEKEHFQSQ